ncbi:unnamed protein product, partial [Heterotrigona itama]
MDVTYLLRSDYAFNKKLLELLGLWPTVRSKFRVVLFYIYYVSSLLLQIHDHRKFPPVNPVVLSSLSLCRKLKISRVTLDIRSVHDDRSRPEFLQERQTEYQDSSKIRDGGAHLLVAICLTIIAVMSLLPVITSAFHVPKENDIRYWQRPIALKSLEKTVSFCNPFFILFLVTNCLSGIIAAAIELTSLAFSEHLCALFKIVSCHLKRATNEYVMKLPLCDQTNNIYTKIIIAVQVHRRAI